MATLYRIDDVLTLMAAVGNAHGCFVGIGANMQMITCRRCVLDPPRSPGLVEYFASINPRWVDTPPYFVLARSLDVALAARPHWQSPVAVHCTGCQRALVNIHDPE